MWHMGGVEGGKVQNHWQMTDPHSGADRGQARSAQPVKRRHKLTGWPGKYSCLGRRMARGQFDANKIMSTQTTAAKATSWAFLRRHLVVGRGSHPEGPSDCGDWGLGPLDTPHGPEAAESATRRAQEAPDHPPTILFGTGQL